MEINLFKKYWKLNNKLQNDYFIKSSNKALTEKELKEIQQFIFELQQKGLPSSKIIAKLQEYNTKLTEKYRAERVFWTEVKRRESNQVVEAGENLELDEYRWILSPHACKICRKVSNNGKRIFTAKEVADGQVPPAITHPNCYCILVPK
jgi:SPP1 gp7 family putative phage head morphogenesis protein